MQKRNKNKNVVYVSVKIELEKDLRKIELEQNFTADKDFDFPIFKMIWDDYNKHLKRINLDSF